MGDRKQESKRMKNLKHQSRRQSIKEGIFAASSFSLGDRFISPFIIALNASNSLVAMISSITGFLGPLSQLFGSKTIRKNSRKKIITKSVLFESLMWIPLVITAILFSIGIIVNILPLAALISFSFLTIFRNFSYPAWFSWMGSIVDDDYRGRWFSKRRLIKGIIAIILAITASFILDYLKKQNLTMLGFIILFTLAFIFRLFSIKAFKKQYEPRLHLKKGDYLSFKYFIKQLPKTNFGKFTIFRALLAFSISVTSSLVAIYLLRYLNFRYSIYMLITIAGTFFSLMFLEIWGKIADKYGNFKVILLTTIIIPIVPLLWILSENPIYLIIIPSAIGGVVWSGFILASGNFVYDSVEPKKRGLVISYFNIIVGIGILLGAGLGALLIKYITSNIIEPLFAIFIFGSILRMIVVSIFIPKFKETRKSKNRGSLRKMIIRETKPTLIEEANQIMTIKRYLHE